MARNKGRGKTLRNSDVNSDKLHIIFMRGFGRIRSVRVSSNYLILFALFLVVYITISALVIDDYIDLRLENRTLREKNKKLERMANDYKFKSKMAKQYDDLKEDLIRAEKKSSGSHTELVEEETVAESSNGNGEVSENGNGEKPAEVSEQPDEEKAPVVAVEVSQLKLESDDAAGLIKFSFSLRKVDKELDLVSGYTIVVLENRSVNPPVRIPFPASIKLENGAPVNLKRGQQFAIRHGKTIKGQLRPVKNPSSFRAATIFVYSFKGELLLRESIVVKNGEGNN